MTSLPRRAVRRALVPLRRRRLTPVLSVVVPVYDVAAWLPQTLDSLLGQTLRDLEVIAVDDSSPDDSLAILRRYAARDPRLRVLTVPNGGQGAARNRGVELARGEFLTFVDSDDTLPPHALEHMVATLRRSGSDLCVGGVRRMRRTGFVRLAWARTVHSRDRIGTTLEEFPGAMQDIIACNRVFRTAFWRGCVGGFPVGTAYEDHVPMLAAYVRAERFDVLTEPTYNWRIREDRSSTGQQKATLRNLSDRVRVKRDAEELLDAEASPRVREIWVGRTLEVDFPPFLKHALVGDADYRELLAATLRRYLGQATPGALALVSARQKVRVELAAAGRWDDLAAAEEWFDDVGLVPPAVVEDGAVVAVLPDLPFLRGLPDHVRALSSLECHHQAVLDHVWSASGTLHLEGWSVLRGLGVPGLAEVSAWLEGPGGARLDLEARAVHRDEAELWGKQQWASYAGGGFAVVVDPAALPAGPWHLRVRTAYAGVSTEGPVLESLPRSGARGTRHLRVAGRDVETGWDPGEGFTVRATAARGAVPGSRTPQTGPRVVDLDATGYEVTLRLDDDRVVPLDGADRVVDERLLGRLPVHLSTPTASVEVGVGADARLLTTTAAPIPLADRGAAGQRRLLERQRALALSDAEPQDAVLLRGADQVLAVDEVLARDHPGVERWWSVPDPATPVPEGARALLERSAAWYDALARCRWLVTDTELAVPAPWRGPRQRRVRLAGRPDGPVGAARWRAEALAPDVVRRRQREARRQWDVLVVPDEETAATYRAAYDWEGPVRVAPGPADIVSDLF